MVDVVAKSGAGLILMHMQGTPKDMQRAPTYRDVVCEVQMFLDERVQVAGEAGIAADRILLDPGIGFGKNLDHTLTLLARLDEVSLNRPIVIGVSRKAFIGRVLDRRVDERLMGTAAAVSIAVLKGARVVRVHDVGAMRDVVRMADAIMNYQQSTTSAQVEQADR